MVSPKKLDGRELLRNQAENLLSKKPRAAREAPAEDMKRLIHELEVHQIELEMQNEELRRAQEELEESRSKYANLYEFAPLGYFTLGKDGLIEEANLTGAHLLGSKKRSLLNVPFGSFVSPEDQDAFHIYFRKVLQMRVRQACDLRLKKEDGTFFYALVESVAVQDKEENLTKIRSAVTDITGRKTAEERNRKLNEELSHRVKEIDCLYSVCYSIERKYSGLEEKLRKIVSQILSAWPHPESASARIVFEEKEFKTKNFISSPWKKTSKIVIDGKEVGDVEVHYRGKRPENEQVAFLEEKKGLIDAIAVDLGEMIGHQRASEALEKNERLLRTVLETIPFGVWVTDSEGRLIYSNPAGEMIWGGMVFTGIDRYHLCKGWRTHSGKRLLPDEWPLARAVTKGELVIDQEIEIEALDGTRKIILTSAVPIRGPKNEIMGGVLVNRDISLRKRHEEELRRSEEQLRYLSSQLLGAEEKERKRISREIHDSIGQLLTAIKFRVDTALQQMNKGMNQAAVNSLMGLGPIISESIEESRRIQMDLRPSILDDLGVLPTLSWFCRQFQTTYAAIGIDKEFDVGESEVPLPLKTVIYRIAQEALNNIAKHGKADRIRLFLRKKDGRLELSIEDNGQGFDLQKALDSGDSPHGLGLTSMRERAEFSGGSFQIESTIGKGTVIRAAWPLA